MSYLVGFAPWIAFWVLAARNGNERDTLLLACVVGLAISIVAVILQGPKIGVSSLDIGSIVFFAGFAVASQLADDQWLSTYNQFVAITALLVIVVAGIAVGKPFTLTYARAATPEVMWNEPHFVHMNTVITRVWAGVFAIMMLSSGALLFVDTTSTNELVLNWIIPFSAFGVCIAWQSRFIAQGIARGRSAAAAQLAQPIAPGAPVVTGVDHITTVLPTEDARRLANTLTHSLHLVRAWDYRDFGDFRSGGWRIGNVNLEVIGIDAEAEMPTRFVTLAPTSLEGLAEELDRRGIAHSEPKPQDDAQGQTLYVRVELPDTGYVTHLCAYMIRTAAGAQESRPNPAGLRHVTEVQVVSDDVDGLYARWATLLAPLVPGRDRRFELETGPAVALGVGPADDVAGITIEVNDLDHARGMLAQAGLTGDDGAIRFGNLAVHLATAPVPAPVAR